MQHWQCEYARILQGSSKALLQMLDPHMTLCVRMSLCVAEVHASPRLQWSS